MAIWYNAPSSKLSRKVDTGYQNHRQARHTRLLTRAFSRRSLRILVSRNIRKKEVYLGDREYERESLREKTREEEPGKPPNTGNPIAKRQKQASRRV